ncbi:hypothetical protein CLTEP_24230 [Clostridium tepidiprofundi DSM 19306]|uniref:ABC-2 family transporter protein n=1 Tax=Clostridium tepidiprofundi DSM 19306 TaxID=1121338 RepID=A0A151ATZ3_9CLOT|nr:hypothetical protein [Clostridium tepidiprofundi]KYH31144.1 hypothetical protein CLTEP_24230 [Clostridium tepidiprofundi DSM 19306]
MKTKKIILILILPIVLIILKSNYLSKVNDLSSSIIILYNYFNYNHLIDITSIVIYSLPLSIWVFIVAVTAKSYYDNYTFLVTRLGGKRIFSIKLLVNVFKKAFITQSTMYVFTMLLLLFFYSDNTISDLNTILISFIMNYTLIIIFVLITLIFMIFYSFSISLSLAYINQITFLVIGLFSKYMGKTSLLSKNPIMLSIVFSNTNTLKINLSDYLTAVIINVLFIIFLIVLYMILLFKKEIY